MAELKSPNQKPPTIEKIREELDDGKFSSGAYHRPLVASQELPPTDKASQEQKSNKGINARPRLVEFVPPQSPVENNNPEMRERNAKIAHLVLELGIPEEFVDEYYLRSDGGYAAKDVSGEVVAVEEDGEVKPPEPDEE